MTEEDFTKVHNYYLNQVFTEVEDFINGRREYWKVYRSDKTEKQNVDSEYAYKAMPAIEIVKCLEKYLGKVNFDNGEVNFVPNQ